MGMIFFMTPVDHRPTFWPILSFFLLVGRRHVVEASKLKVSLADPPILKMLASMKYLFDEIYIPISAKRLPFIGVQSANER